MTHTKEFLVQAEALFVSALQPSDRPAAGQIQEAISTSLRTHRGAADCAAVIAADFSRTPNEAVDRLSWVLTLLPG